MNRLNSYDQFWIRIAGFLVKRWNNTFGKNNISLAKVFLKLGFFLVCLSFVVEYIIQPNIWSILFTFMWIYIYRNTNKFLNSLKNSMDDMEDGVISIKLDIKLFNSNIFRARCFTFIAVFALFLSLITLTINHGLYGTIGVFLAGFSIYIGFFLTPAKKEHAFARAKKKVKELATSTKEKAKDLIPSPVPAPVAVRI